jgi:hypothetical protein
VGDRGGGGGAQPGRVRVARISMPGPRREMRGARMKTISSGPPERAVSERRMAESFWRP